MEMKWGERGNERERDGVGCVGMAWPLSNKLAHTHTHTHNLKFTDRASESSRVCADGILLRCTTLFKGLIYSDSSLRSTKGHHQPILREHRGQHNRTCNRVFKEALSVNEGFSPLVIHGSKKLHPT